MFDALFLSAVPPLIVIVLRVSVVKANTKLSQQFFCGWVTLEFHAQPQPKNST